MEAPRDAIREWAEQATFVLSCPGPLRRHVASLLPAAGLALPQVLLGGEAQLLAFVAANPDLAGRCFFAPLPELFSSAASLETAWRACGGEGAPPRRIVHLRFGSTRMARILKPARNAAVVAERHGAGPVTASHHPFASGLVLPAAMRRVFVYGPEDTRPQAIGGEILPVSRLPAACVTADLDIARAARRESGRRRRAGHDPAAAGLLDQDTATDTATDTAIDPGLDLVAFADFRSGAWAAGTVRGRVAQLRGVLREARRGEGSRGSDRGSAPFVLLPWNMDHPGSIVPELLTRLTRLSDPAAPRAHVVVLPFNYLGQTGIIRRLIGQVREVAGGDDRILGQIHIGRLSRLDALKQLGGISPVAWVDGNDPEHAWTTARLAAAGLSPILLGTPSPADPAPPPHLPCEEAISIEVETRYGALNFAARVPALRDLPALLALTQAVRDEPRAVAPPRRALRLRSAPA